MKFFHLADLHIGKIVNGFSMLEDQLYVFDQILGQIAIEKPDVLVIAGDIYDKATPSAEAVQVFDSFLTQLRHTNITVLIVAGNHDSPERLSFGNRIMSENNIHICGMLEGNLQTVSLSDEYGEVAFHLLPFVKPSTVRRFFEDESIESYQSAVQKTVASASVDFTKRNVLVSHQFYINGGSESPERSDSEVGPIGGIDSVDISCVSGFDYVALGHLHGPQKIGKETIRYAGSPLKYSASECSHKKSITMIELKEKDEIIVTPLPLIPLRDMRKIKGPLNELISKSILSQENTNDYVHVTLTDNEELMDAIGKLRRAYPHVMTLSFENTRTKALSNFDEALGDTMEKVQFTMIDLFDSFFKEQNGEPLNEKQLAIASSIFEQLGGNL